MYRVRCRILSIALWTWALWVLDITALKSTIGGMNTANGEGLGYPTEP